MKFIWFCFPFNFPLFCRIALLWLTVQCLYFCMWIFWNFLFNSDLFWKNCLRSLFYRLFTLFSLSHGVQTRVGHAVAPNARTLYIRAYIGEYMYICANMRQCASMRIRKKCCMANLSANQFPFSKTVLTYSLKSFLGILRIWLSLFLHLSLSWGLNHFPFL